jgi:hypothetical protein
MQYQYEDIGVVTGLRKFIAADQKAACPMVGGQAVLSVSGIGSLAPL